MSTPIEDRLALQELVNRYAYHIDHFEIDAWVDTFAPDAHFDESAFDYGVHVGHDEIRAYAQQLVQHTASAVHLMANQVIVRLDESEAAGTIAALVEGVRRSGGSRRRYHVTYDDEYVKIDGQWKISRRVLRKMMPTEVVSSE